MSLTKSVNESKDEDGGGDCLDDSGIESFRVAAAMYMAASTSCRVIYQSSGMLTLDLNVEFVMRNANDVLTNM